MIDTKNATSALPKRKYVGFARLPEDDEVVDRDENNDEDKETELRWRMSSTNLDIHNSTTESVEYIAEEEHHLPQSYIVIRFPPKIPGRTLIWLVNKIRGKRRDGGAELAVMRQPYNEKEGVVLHVSASKIKFLQAAEELEIVKKDKLGVMREFVVCDMELFLGEDKHVEDLLSVTERQNIVRHELENIRALVEDDTLPGYPNIELYEGQSILHACVSNSIIKNIYPLHDKETLKKLGKKWFLGGLFNKQPIEEIREYFGEGIALYFTFLGYYTKWLLIPVLIGCIQLLPFADAIPFFCLFNVVWVTVFLEVWKRKSNSRAFKWGTIGMTSLDEPRPNFYGPMGVDIITGKVQPQYPRYKTNLKMYCVSFPIVFLCLSGAFMVMLASFWMEDYIRNPDSELSATLLPLPSILYTGLVYVMNVYYRMLATHLTEWENHRTQSQYDRHRVTKLVLFEFVNNFMSLFYIAFITQDMEMLRNQLATMLIILQVINNIQEAILPLVLRFWQVKMTQLKEYLRNSRPVKEKRPKFAREYSTYEPLHDVAEIPADDPRIQDSDTEGEMENYEGTYDDYLEMFIQFGYVVLFSSVYPIAAFWAFFNNVLEIRADAFKLCVIYQRPMGKRVKDIGAWQKAFSAVGALSIMTNCGLLCLNQNVRSFAPESTPVRWCMMFVVLEHLLLLLRYILHIAIADRPEWVRIALAKKNHDSKVALKFERAVRSRQILTRRFKTVHGPHSHRH